MAQKRDRVFPNTATLYPISIADLLLRTAELGIVELLWSQHLLDEVTRVLTEKKSLPKKAAEYFCHCIRETFPQGCIDHSTYQHLLATRSGPDPNDHEHSAAASAGHADILLSADRAGFPLRDTLPARRRHPDDYFVELLKRYPTEILTVIREMGNGRRVRESPPNPQRTAPRRTTQVRARRNRTVADLTENYPLSESRATPGQQHGTCTYQLARSSELIVSAAARSHAGMDAAYTFRVVDTRAWPSLADTTGKATPAASICVATKCRRSCNRK